MKTTNQQIKVNVNCLTSHDKSLVSGDFRNKLTFLLDKAKETDYWKTLPEVCHETSFKKGRRYKDTERCVSVILGCVWRACEDENQFINYLDEINSEELTQLVDDCLRYSGGCDHWYTYEKEW